MAAAGLGRNAQVIEKNYGFVLADGTDAMRRIHREMPATTAVMCNSDVFAFGVLAECKKLGIKVPDDLSVTGFDDFDFSIYLDPPLTTVRVPAREMGAKAAELLLNAVVNGVEINSVRLEADLIVRSSSGSPPHSLGAAPPKASILEKGVPAPRSRTRKYYAG